MASILGSFSSAKVKVTAAEWWVMVTDEQNYHMDKFGKCEKVTHLESTRIVMIWFDSTSIFQWSASRRYDGLTGLCENSRGFDFKRYQQKWSLHFKKEIAHF